MIITKEIKLVVAWVALVIIIALVASNIVLFRWWQGAKEDLTRVETSRDSWIETADKCSKSVAALEDVAKQNALKHADAVASAASAAFVRGQRAQKILRTPPSTPGNDCKSADDRARAWLKERGQ